MSMYATLLLVDDDKNTREGLAQFLEGLDYEVLTASSGEEAVSMFKKERPDVVLSDIRMPGMDGLELLDKLRSINPQALIILLTAYGTVEDAVKAMNRGAFHYLTKPVNLDELKLLVKKALNSRKLEEENRELRKELFREKFEHGEILAQSAPMQSILKTVDQVAKTASTVLIEGESGTGKELLAHRIHELSPRHQKPFIAVHCAALTESLLASELFGHERGAFTGANERKIGRFERAHEGTLFLDEVGEITQETQVKLLRVLQEKEFERVGGVKTIKTDVRLICATNKNLLDEVRAGRFREDLYYRINVILLKVPPLRERREDIPALAKLFLRQFAQTNVKNIEGFEPDALQALKNYSWPGNVRELRNIIERMVVLTQDKVLPLNQVPEDIRSGSGGMVPASREGAFVSAPGSSKLQDMEKEYIVSALKQTAGNKSLAAKHLGISRRTLYRKIDEYGLKNV